MKNPFRRRSDASQAAADADMTGPPGELREFVYLDEVSVESLRVSQRGPLPATIQEMRSTALAAEIAGTAGAGAGPIKAEIRASMQSTRSDQTQILRKVIIQSTFAGLLKDSADKLVLSAAGGPSMVSRSEDGVIDDSQLKRGELVELTVTLSTHPLYRIGSVIGAIADMTNELRHFQDAPVPSSFSQLLPAQTLLRQLLAGFIPIEAEVTDYVVVERGGTEKVVRRDAIAAQSKDTYDAIHPLKLTALTDETMYWKDLRRILFSASPYNVLCRLSGTGFSRTWNPVAMRDLIEEYVPVMGKALDGLEEAAKPGLRPNAVVNVFADALRIHIEATLKASGVSPNKDQAKAITLLAGRLSQNTDSETARRQAFAASERFVAEEWQLQPSREALLESRRTSLALATLTAAQVDDVPKPSDESRYLSAEIVAIYW